MLTRVLEDEVMDTAQEAADYNAMDHSAVNLRFCQDLLAVSPDPRSVVDVGTGTALIPIQLCRLQPRCTITATDLADHMLALARKNVADAGFSSRITPLRADAKGGALAAHAFDVVMSNSIIHHIPEPAAAFREMLRLLAPGGTLFVRDLARPRDDEDVRHLVATYAANDTPRQRGLFEASLRAALSLDELRAILAPLGIAGSSVSMTSDRHWTLVHRP